MKLRKEEIKILIVEDNNDTLELITRHLILLGYTLPENACDGAEAFSKVISYKPHLILMDTDMPGPSGYTVCRRLNEQESGTRMAIIGMSEGDENGTKEQLWKNAGADDFIKKEFFSGDKSFLEKKIQIALEKYYHLS